MRSTTARKPAILVLAMLFLCLLVAPAGAVEPPANDDFDDATAITALPFNDAVDTREATEADDDPDCVGAGPTVWYALTLDEDSFVEVDTFGSDYDTTLSAYLGERGDLDQIACNDDAGGSLQSRIRFAAAADTTVFIMVGAFESGDGGALVLNADHAVGVDCAAEVIDEFEDAAVYLVEGGELVDCVAFGLDPEGAARWQVEFFEAGFPDDDFDDFVGFIRDVAASSEPVASDGETDRTPEGDGSMSFAFEAPEVDAELGVFVGSVAQGPVGDETYFEEFLGFVLSDFEFVEGAMKCAPDPVRQGATVECRAEEMTTGEFDWAVKFFTVRELLLALVNGDVFDGVSDPDIRGVGAADEDRVGTFDFAVPTDGTIEVYVAFAEQEDYFALYAGAVDPPAAVTPTVARPKPTAQTPTPAAPRPAPVAVRRPQRVETGAGGAAPADGPPVGLLLSGAALAIGALALHQRRRPADRG
jgi:hypothetical protein